MSETVTPARETGTNEAAVPAPRRGRGLPGFLNRSTRLRHLVLAVLAGVVLFLLTQQLDPFRNFQLATVAAYLCATAGLTLLVGMNGQLSLGHGALMAVGAYTVALTQNALADRGITGNQVLPLSLALGVLVTMAAGAVIGLAAARLRGPYLAGVTLAVAVAVPAATVTFDEVFNSEQGLSVAVEPPPLSLGLYFPNERWRAWVALTGALLTMLLLANLVRSRVGRNLRAVRDDEVAARLAGIHVGRTQVLAFVVSAASAGLGGGLLALLAQSVSPGAFSLTLSLFLLMAVVIGGLGSLSGAVWGAILLVALPDLTHDSAQLVSLPPAVAQRLEGNLPLAVFGLTLIVVMIAAPGGVQGLLRRIGARARRRAPAR
ncbi:branched-chain amino acid ABC transporter permease [Catellatospora methionotrophica]|uniref:branched-chain amino acid ABC transporter permease n=1 Tax=Catellatospora methionotrophica TaxID=121620 RepID=UPI0033F4FF7E